MGKYLWWGRAWDQGSNLWHLRNSSSHSHPTLHCHCKAKFTKLSGLLFNIWGIFSNLIFRIEEKDLVLWRCVHLVPHLSIPSLPFKGGPQSESVNSSQRGGYQKKKKPHPDWGPQPIWEEYKKVTRRYTGWWVRGTRWYTNTITPLVKEYTLKRLKIWSVTPVTFVTQQALWYYMVPRFPKPSVRCLCSFVRYC